MFYVLTDSSDFLSFMLSHANHLVDVASNLSELTWEQASIYPIGLTAGREMGIFHEISNLSFIHLLHCDV